MLNAYEHNLWYPMHKVKVYVISLYKIIETLQSWSWNGKNSNVCTLKTKIWASGLFWYKTYPNTVTLKLIQSTPFKKKYDTTVSKDMRFHTINCLFVKLVDPLILWNWRFSKDFYHLQKTITRIEFINKLTTITYLQSRRKP